MSSIFVVHRKAAVGLAAALGAIVSSSALANPIPDNDMAEVRPQNASNHEAEKAQPTTMPWCGGPVPSDEWATGRIKRAIFSRDDYELWSAAAEHMCGHKTEPTWIKQATYLVQTWMNARQGTQAEAEKEIKDKIASVKFEHSPAGQQRAADKQFEFSSDDVAPTKADELVDTVKPIDKLSWCDATTIDKSDLWDHSRIKRTVDQPYGIDGTIEGAAHLCQRASDPTWKAYAAKVVQKWMNWTYMSQAEAEKSIRARVQARFTQQRDELCKALEVSPEIGGSERAFAAARRDLFACEDKHSTLWQDHRAAPIGVGYYIDAETAPDELMRAYWLLGYVIEPFDKKLPATKADDNRPLLYYAIAQTDMAKLDYAAIDKMLSAPPYNEYARTIVMETLARLKAEQKYYERALDQMTKGDEEYTAILRTAPKKAFEQWDKMSGAWKAEIERSNAFEHLFSSPSHKALKGCAANLIKDGEKLIKSYKSNVYKDLVDKISADPVGNLLLGRIALCFAVDDVWGGSGALRDLVTKGRAMRGPRSLAYYAVVEAVAKASKDRPRLLLNLSNFYMSPTILNGGFEPPGKDLDFTGSAPREWEKSDLKGVVASTKKVDDGVLVVFKTVKLKLGDSDCVDDTSHPLKIDGNGRIEYYRNCKPNGKIITVDITPNSIVISPLLAANIKPGVFVQFVDSSPHNAKSGHPFGVIVYTKTSPDAKKIDTFFGFAL